MVWETRFVLLAFLSAGVTGAIISLAQQVNHSGGTSRFPQIVHHAPVANMLLGIIAYSAVGGMVPLVLLLLVRTGQPPRWLGLGIWGAKGDLLPAVGLVGLSLASQALLAALLSPIELAH